MRRNIIQRFMSKWRNEVGDDFYPAMRLLLPDKDRDRPMYGLKEKAIGKLLVKLMKISPDSEDGFSLTNWKLPGQTAGARGAGDFTRRCYEVLSKRGMRATFGNMRIAEVNELLDKLAAAQGEAQQLPIFETFYEKMNADELMWLIRIILREMKFGASEKTLLNVSAVLYVQRHELMCPRFGTPMAKQCSICPPIFVECAGTSQILNNA